MRWPHRDVHVGWLPTVTALAVAVMAAALVGTIAPALRPAFASGRLTAAEQLTGVIPVPAGAHRCGSQLVADPGSTRWCLPAGTSPTALRRWYGGRLPAGRDAAGLRWCLAQVQSDGSTTALWVSAGGLVGYQLPPTSLRPTGIGEEPGRLETVRRPGHACPRVARSMRSRAG